MFSLTFTTQKFCNHLFNNIGGKLQNNLSYFLVVFCSEEKELSKISKWELQNPSFHPLCLAVSGLCYPWSPLNRCRPEWSSTVPPTEGTRFGEDV